MLKLLHSWIAKVTTENVQILSFSLNEQQDSNLKFQYVDFNNALCSSSLYRRSDWRWILLSAGESAVKFLQSRAMVVFCFHAPDWTKPIILRTTWFGFVWHLVSVNNHVPSGAVLIVRWKPHQSTSV
jgi:hypothetical protein